MSNSVKPYLLPSGSSFDASAISNRYPGDDNPDDLKRPIVAMAEYELDLDDADNPFGDFCEAIERYYQALGLQKKVRDLKRRSGQLFKTENT